MTRRGKPKATAEPSMSPPATQVENASPGVSSDGAIHQPSTPARADSPDTLGSGSDVVVSTPSRRQAGDFVGAESLRVNNGYLSTARGSTLYIPNLDWSRTFWEPINNNTSMHLLAITGKGRAKGDAVLCIFGVLGYTNLTSSGEYVLVSLRISHRLHCICSDIR